MIDTRNADLLEALDRTDPEAMRWPSEIFKMLDHRLARLAERTVHGVVKFRRRGVERRRSR